MPLREDEVQEVIAIVQAELAKTKKKKKAKVTAPVSKPVVPKKTKY
jgi:hypothetical protein